MRSVLGLIKLDSRHDCRTECTADKRFGIFAPSNNLQLFITEFGRNRAMSHALWTNACALRVNVRIVARHGDLRTTSRFSCNAFDDDLTISQLGNLLLKQQSKQLRMRARDDNRRIVAFPL